MRTFTSIVAQFEGMSKLGPNKVAVMTAEVVDNWCQDWDENKSVDTDTAHLFVCIQLAIENWCRASEDGRDTVRSYNFNIDIEDLRDTLVLNDGEGNDNFSFWLLQQGVTKLTILIAESEDDHNWEWDDNLFDEMAISTDEFDELDEEQQGLDEEQQRRDEKRGLYPQHEDAAN